MLDTTADTIPYQIPSTGTRTPVHPRRIDVRRLALMATLTEAAVPPLPGDRQAVALLATLDEDAMRCVIRWLACAADLPEGNDAAKRLPPPPDPRTVIDPRLLT